MSPLPVKQLARGALIGALYALLTFALQPISSGLVQVRFSEALSILPWFTAAAVPGLFVGCVAANLMVGASIYDIVFGSLATLIAAALTRAIKKRGLSPWLAPLPAVAVNALVVGALLTYVYGVGVPYPTAALYVAVGQTLACYGVGMPLLFILEKYADKLF